MRDFEGKVALVTGASRRIGAGIAVAMGKRGASVVVNYFSRREMAEDVARRVEEAGGRALVIQADVRDRGAVHAMVAKTLGTFGRIDFLINNARVIHPQNEFLDLDWKEHMLGQIEVHLGGAFHCCQEVVPHMKERGSGVIINVLSNALRTATPRLHAYGPAKAALRNFTMNLAVDLGPNGIRVNSVTPGTTESADSPSRRDEAELERRLKGIPLRRIGVPDEVADVVAFLCSEDARYICGVDLAVNGGSVITL